MTTGRQVQAAEGIKPVPEARLKEIVRQAPKLPVDLDLGLIAGVVADGMYGKVTSGGVEVSTMPAEKAKAIILKGFDEFIDRYGKYKSLKGIALGSMETIGFYDTLYDKGMVDDVVAHIKKRRPDFEVLTYLGNRHLQEPYFSGKRGSPTTGDVISRWETSGQDWSEFLAGEVHENFKRWKHDPAEMKKAGLNVYEMFHPNDQRRGLERQVLRPRFSDAPFRQGVSLAAAGADEGGAGGHAGSRRAAAAERHGENSLGPLQGQTVQLPAETVCTWCPRSA
ncbi:MAG: hypothetical protein GWP05_08190 [Anaerolineaceae bacterium]|nr:hypothetical protein [Anaerolineaceae bacterium]